MTALRVVDQYTELSDVPSGSYTPTEINSHLGSLLSASYVVISTTSSLENERALVAGTGLKLADGGPNGNVTLSVDDGIVATVSGTTFTGAVSFSQGLSGSLTQLTTGASYLVAGENVTIVSSSNGQITISSTDIDASITGTLRDPGNTLVSTGSVSIDASNRTASQIGSDVFFFVSGSTSVTSGPDRKVSVFGGDIHFSGSTTHSGGISGSLQRLADGVTYLVAGQNVSITTASNGQITINNTFSGSNRLDTDGYDIIVWKLNELAGDTLANTGASGSSGDLTGSAQLVYGRSGIYDTSIDFRGYNTATFASASSLVKPKDYDINISSWIYPYQFMSGVVVMKNSTTGNYDALSPIILGVTGAYGNPFIQIKSTNTTKNLLLVEVSRSLRVYTWNHFGCSISGSGTSAVVKMYLNGDFIKSMVISGSIDYVSGGWWAVGGIPTAGAEAGDYKLNDIRIANTVRDAAWWRNIYTNGVHSVGQLGPSGSSATITGTWRDPGNTFVTTGSVSIDSQNRTVSQIGSDIFLFVSGNIGLSGTSSGKIAAFGGDVKISGSLQVGTGSTYINSTQIGWDVTCYIEASSSILKFHDINNPVGATLAQLMQSGTAGALSSVTGTWRDTGSAFVTTGSVSVDSQDRTAATIGTDVFFFVSGSLSASSGANRKVAVFGGDVVVSGNITYPNQVTTSSHETLRQLIHLADKGGPFAGFSGAVKDCGPYPFTTASIWWTDVTMTKKIVEKLITRNANSAPSIVQWKAYDTDGVTVTETATDVIVYNGAYEISRTRTVS